MGKQREENRFIIDKNQPYEYNIAIIILGEPRNEGIIDIFDMTEALIKLRKLYNLRLIGISASVRKTKSSYSNIIETRATYCFKTIVPIYEVF